MPKIKLLKNVPVKGLLEMIPPDLRAFIDIDAMKTDKVNVALFSIDNRYVATSSEVRKIIEKSADLKPLLVAGRAFTLEASTLIRQKADYFVFREDSFWTDQRYIEARQSRP